MLMAVYCGLSTIPLRVGTVFRRSLISGFPETSEEFTIVSVNTITNLIVCNSEFKHCTFYVGVGYHPMYDNVRINDVVIVSQPAPRTNLIYMNYTYNIVDEVAHGSLSLPSLSPPQLTRSGSVADDPPGLEDPNAFLVVGMRFFLTRHATTCYTIVSTDGCPIHSIACSTEDYGLLTHFKVRMYGKENAYFLDTRYIVEDII